jgi:hypothetical protein
MQQAVHSIENEPAHTVEIVVHITDTLDEQHRANLVAAVVCDDGIISAEFCQTRYHLMLIRYDRYLYSSQDVLDRVKAKQVSAQLVGPV